MNKIAIATLVGVLGVSGSALAIEPIPGSITYNGHVAQLEKSAVGSTVFHTFNSNGNDYREVYTVAADRTLHLVSRSAENN